MNPQKEAKHFRIWQLLKLYQNEITINEIAEELKLKPGYVAKVLRERGWRCKSGSPKKHQQPSNWSKRIPVDTLINYPKLGYME